MIWKTYNFTLHTLLLNIDHNMIQHCDKYLRCTIFISFVKFNAIVKLIHKHFTQVYYLSDFTGYIVYECIKHKIIMLFLKYKCWNTTNQIDHN